MFEVNSGVSALKSSFVIRSLKVSYSKTRSSRRMFARMSAFCNRWRQTENAQLLHFGIVSLEFALASVADEFIGSVEILNHISGLHAVRDGGLVR